MLRLFLYIFTAFGLLFADEKEPTAEIVSNSLKCQKIKIMLEMPNNDDLKLDAKDLLKDLIENLNNSCEFIDEDSIITIGYESEFKADVSVTNSFVASDSRSAKVNIELKIENKLGTYTSFGNSRMLVGQNLVLSPENKSHLVDRAFINAWEQIMKFITDEHFRRNDDWVNEQLGKE